MIKEPTAHDVLSPARPQRTSSTTVESGRLRKIVVAVIGDKPGLSDDLDADLPGLLAGPPIEIMSDHAMAGHNEPPCERLANETEPDKSNRITVRHASIPERR